MNKKEVAEMAAMKQKLTGVDDKLDTHIIEQREDFERLFLKLDELNQTFAGKWVEKAAIDIIIGLGVGIITLVINIIG